MVAIMQQLRIIQSTVEGKGLKKQIERAEARGHSLKTETDFYNKN